MLVELAMERGGRDDDAQAPKVHGADMVPTDLSGIAAGAAAVAQGRGAVPVSTAGPAAALLRPSAIEKPQPDSPADAVEAGPWTLCYEGFDPALEGRRESLFTLGNGYFATRGAAAEAVADGVHYPGTYLAGGYNRLTTEIAGRAIENEDLVNWPNWLPLAVRSDDAPEWFDPRNVAGLLQYRQDLDLRRGLYRRCVRIRDAVGRVTRLEECRFVHIRDKHLAGLRLRVTAENWSGRLVVRSAIDGRITNAGVLRYKPFNGRHIEILDSTAVGSDTILIEADLQQAGLNQGLQMYLFRPGERLIEPLNAGDVPVEIDSAALKIELARLDAGNIEQVADQCPHAFRQLANEGQKLHPLPVFQAGFVEQQFGHALDGAQRRAQVVRGDAEKLVLDFVRRFERQVLLPQRPGPRFDLSFQADVGLAQLVDEPGPLTQQDVMLDRFFDNRDDLTRLPGLGQIKINLALVHGTDDRVDVRVTGD